MLWSLILIASLACGGGSTGPNGSLVGGSWRLQSVAGRSLPTQVDTYNTIQSDVLVFQANGVVNDTYISGQSGGPIFVSTSTGAWVLTGATVTITYSNGASLAGVFSGESLTLQSTGGAWIYARF